LPRDRGRLDASLERRANRIQFARCQRIGTILDTHLPGLWHWFHPAGRQATAAFGLYVDSDQQRIELGIVQPLQRSG
jgi:hypothetical protein